MKIFFKSILLVLLVVNLLQANEENNNSISQTRTWHYAFSIGDSINLFTEKRFEGHSAMLINLDVNPRVGKGLNVSYMYYNDQDAYFLEGLYYNLGIGLYDQEYIGGLEDRTYKAFAGVGYGWHFLYDFLTLGLNVGIQYKHHTYSDPEYTSSDEFTDLSNIWIALLF